MECPVCLEKTPPNLLRCGHHLCECCGDKWFQTSQTCPVCRTPVLHPDFIWNDCCPPAPPPSREQELERRFVLLILDLFQNALHS